MQSMGAERFGEIQIPLAFTAQVDPLRPDMPRRLAGSNKTQMSGFLRRIIDEAMIMGRERACAGCQNRRRDPDMLCAGRDGISFDFEGNILARFVLRLSRG